MYQNDHQPPSLVFLLHELDSGEENFTRYVIVVIFRTSNLTHHIKGAATHTVMLFMQRPSPPQVEWIHLFIEGTEPSGQ
jgi:hypothetical protein